MGYIVERDVEIEIIEEAPNGIMREYAFTTTVMAPASHMPKYTQEQLRAGLSEEWIAMVERAVATAAGLQGN